MKKRIKVKLIADLLNKLMTISHLRLKSLKNM